MANVKCNVASDLNNLKPATNDEYSSLVGELYTNQKNGFVNNWVGNQTRGVKGINETIIAEHKRDAEDVFSSAILYMLEKAYTRYQKASKSNKPMYLYNPNAKGLGKLPCIIKYFSQVIRTKVYHFFRGCKRMVNAVSSYLDALKSGIDMSIYVSADEQTKKAYKKDVEDGKYKKSDGSLSDWIREKSFQSNEGCDVLPKPENRSNSPYFSVVLPDQEALNPENIVIAAEEKSSATIFDFPKINQSCLQAA